MRLGAADDETARHHLGEGHQLNKLLVTGLAIGRDAGVCEACNYDFSWLLTHPSILIWADKILFTEFVWSIVQQEAYPKPATAAKACKLVLDIAQAHGLVEIRKPLPLLSRELGDSIFAQAESDIESIRKLFPDQVEPSRNDHTLYDPKEFLHIGDRHYCAPYLSSAYASLLLARSWDANCLFDHEVFNILRYKFGITALPREADVDTVQSFHQVFDACFPNDPLFPRYAFSSEEECSACHRCKDEFLKDVESGTLQMIKWREYDEVQQARSVVDGIIGRQNMMCGDVEPSEVAREFEELKQTLKRRTKAVFPQAKRWSNVVTMVSIPLAVTGLAAGSSLVTMAGATLAGLAQISKEGIEFLESKYRWAGFLQSLQADPRHD